MNNFDWLDPSMLKDVDEKFREIVRGSLFIDQERCDAICTGISERVQMLMDFINTRARSDYKDDVNFDVTEDDAYNGSK